MIDLNQFATQAPLDAPAPGGPFRDPAAIAASCRAQAAEEQDPALWRRVRAVFNAFCPIRTEADGQSGVALLPHPAEADFLENFIPVPASGQDLRLGEMFGGDQRPSKNYFDLLALAKSIPGLC